MLLFFILGFLIICSRFLYFKFNKKLHSYLKNGPYGDAATYFFLIQFFRKNSCGISDDRCLISKEPVLYTSLYMKIVGKLFSDKILFSKSWLPNYILYIISVFLFLGFIKFNVNLSSNLWVGMLLLFLFQPDNIMLDKDRIHFIVLQPRFLGLIANSVFWFVYVIYGISILSFIVLLLLAIVSINTSLFCRQVTFFSCFFISILMLDKYIFLVLPIAFILSSFIFPREFFPSIKPHLKYSYQYFINYYKPKKSQNLLVNLIKNSFARNFFESYPYFTTIITFIFAFYVYSKGNYDSSIEHGEIIKRACFTYMGFVIIFVLTGVRKFAFLGECWRYFSYTTYFLTPFILPVLLKTSNFSDITIFIIIGLILLIFILFTLFANLPVDSNKNPHLISILNKHKFELQNAIWYGVPFRVSTTAVALGYGLKTFEYQYGNHSLEIQDKYFAEYPYLKWNYAFLNENEVTHILVENEFLDKARSIAGFNISDHKLIDSNPSFSIYSVNY
jgi:hypothetical protein